MSLALTSEEKTFLLNDAVYYEILFALGVSSHDPADYCAWEHVNFARMGHARALLYFFESPLMSKKWDDDVVSEDFGFHAAAVSISKDERDRLNKDLFHLSSRRLRHSQETKPWTNSLLQKIHDRSISFVDHLLSAGAKHDFDVVSPAWEDLADAMKSGRELQIRRHFSNDGRDSGWKLSLGRSLKSGESELTIFHAQ